MTPQRQRLWQRAARLVYDAVDAVCDLDDDLDGDDAAADDIVSVRELLRVADDLVRMVAPVGCYKVQRTGPGDDDLETVPSMSASVAADDLPSPAVVVGVA